MGNHVRAGTSARHDETLRPGSLGRAAAWLSKQLELSLAEVELSLPQYRILGLLAEGSSMPSALAERLAVRRPTITAVVDGLEARGLVHRTPGDADKRNVTHTMSAKGQAALAEADRSIDARLVDIAASLEDPALTDEALHGLELWRRAMRAYHQERVTSPEAAPVVST
jgi:long-chain acyl-CoA synthetase